MAGHDSGGTSSDQRTNGRRAPQYGGRWEDGDTRWRKDRGVDPSDMEGRRRLLDLGRRGEEALFWTSAHRQGLEGILTLLNDRFWRNISDLPTCPPSLSHQEQSWTSSRPQPDPNYRRINHPDGCSSSRLSRSSMPSRMKEDVVPYFVYGTVLPLLSRVRRACRKVSTPGYC